MGTNALSRNSSTSSSVIDYAPEKVFVAVKLEYKQCINNLSWVLQGELAPKRVVLVYVHVPSALIHMMGGLFPAGQLEPDQVAAYRKQERADIRAKLDQYVHACEAAKVQAEKLLIQADDIANGLLKMIGKHGVTKLVMGAAADKNYSKKMKAPKSKTACSVLKDVPPYCSIWFVCRGQVVSVREAVATVRELPKTSETPRTDSSASSQAVSDISSQGSWLSLQDQELFAQAKNNAEFFLRSTSDPMPESYPYDATTPKSQSSIMEVTADFRGTTSSPTGRDHHDCSSEHEPAEDTQLSPTENDYLYNQLKDALNDVARFKDEAHEESRRRARADMELLESNRRIKALESRYAQAMILRKETEELLEKERSESEALRKEIKSLIREKQELEKLREGDAYKELEKVHKQKLALEIQIVELEHTVRDKEEKLSEEQKLQSALVKERDSAVRELEDLRRRKGDGVSSKNGPSSFSEFSRAELDQATRNFDSSLKIGEGGYGSVFRGSLRNVIVAVKLLNAKNLKPRPELLEEIAVINGVRHPNIISLIGMSYEAPALVYEFLPNGSLEDRLACKNGSPPLPRRTRLRILVEICSALIHLHIKSSKSFVHGDVRPSNILLDANYASKLADFGIGRLIQSNASNLQRWTDPKGAFVYLDPEFFSSGELTASSDVYSFGVIILRLLTGKPALGIVREVQDASDRGILASLLDPTAGDWPVVQAQQLAQLGISCCEMMRKRRPDLANDVLRVLESMEKLAS